MKLFFVLAVVVWLICGLTGAWMLDGRDGLHWKAVAWGPVTLAKAFNEKPVSYPGP